MQSLPTESKALILLGLLSWWLLLAGSLKAQSEEGVSDGAPLALSNKVDSHIMKCFESSIGPELHQPGKTVEIVILERGRILITERGEGLDFKLQLVEGNAFEKMKSLILKDPLRGNYCSDFLQEKELDESAAAEVILFLERIQKLEAPLDIEDTIALDVPSVEIGIRLPNVFLSAFWFGCDSSPLAKQVQSFLGKIESRLNPCEAFRPDLLEKNTELQVIP